MRRLILRPTCPLCAAQAVSQVLRVAVRTAAGDVVSQDEVHGLAAAEGAALGSILEALQWRKRSANKILIMPNCRLII